MDNCKYLDKDEISQLIFLVKKLQNGIESEILKINKNNNEKDTMHNG